MILSFIEALAEHFNLFAIIGADALDLVLDSLLEVLLFLLFAPGSTLLDPTLP